MRRGFLTSLFCLLVLVLSFSGVALAGQFDFGGATVNIYWHYADALNWFKEGESRAHLEWVEKEFNVKIVHNNYNSSTMVDDLIAGVMAGEPAGDIYVASEAQMVALARQGAVIPLDDVLDESYFSRLPEAFRNYPAQYGVYDGKLYGLCRHYQPPMTGLVWNKSFFEREGLPDVYELIEAGEWTWDRFREIVVAATKDRDGDGELDQWGFASAAGDMKSIMYSWAFTNGAQLVKNVGDKAVFGFTDPEAIKALDFWGELISRYGVVMGTGLDKMSQYGEGNCAFIAIDHWWMHWFNANMEDGCGLTYLPKGPDAQEFFVPGTILEMWVIPKNSKHDPRAVAELVNALYKYTAPYIDTEAFDQQFIDDFANGMNLDDQESLDWFIDACKIWRGRQNDLISASAPQAWATFWDAIGAVMRGEKTASVAMAEVAPVIQAVLDEEFNK